MDRASARATAGPPTPVLIVAQGRVGRLLALLLGRQGVPSVVLDAPGPQPELRLDAFAARVLAGALPELAGSDLDAERVDAALSRALPWLGAEVQEGHEVDTLEAQPRFVWADGERFSRRGLLAVLCLREGHPLREGVRWRRGRVLTVDGGDLSLGVRDANNLAWKIGRAWSTGEEDTPLLDTYGPERAAQRLSGGRLGPGLLCWSDGAALPRARVATADGHTFAIDQLVAGQFVWLRRPDQRIDPASAAALGSLHVQEVEVLPADAVLEPGSVLRVRDLAGALSALVDVSGGSLVRPDLYVLGAAEGAADRLTSARLVT